MEESNINQNKQYSALNPYASNYKPTTYKTGYQEVDNLTNQGSELINNSVNTQLQSIQQGVNTNINELNRQKQKAEEQTLKNNKGFYQEYAKQINPYGIGQEALAGQGLAHSGIAESTKTNIYNQYQKSVTESLNNLNTIKSDYDAKMAEVRSNGDIAQAEAISNAYLQQLEQLKYAYTLAQAQKEFEYNKSVDDRNYNYQLSRDQIEDQRYADELAYKKERDRVSDDQWRQQFELSKKNSSSASSSRSRSSGSSSSKRGGSSNALMVSDTDSNNNGLSLWEILKRTGQASADAGTIVGNAVYSGVKSAGSNVINNIKNALRK